MAKHLKKKKKLVMKKPKRLAAIIAIFILIIFVTITRNNSIKKKDTESLIVNNEDVTSKIEDKVIIKEDIVYLSFQDVKKCLDPNIYLEDEKIITGSSKKIALLEINKDEIEINGSLVEIRSQPYKNENGIIYIPISELQNVYDMEFAYVPEFKNIVIDSYSRNKEVAEIKRNVTVKLEPKNGSDNIEKLKKGDSVIYISVENGWAKIRTHNGNLGYIKKDILINFAIQREEMQDEIKDLQDISLEKDITNKNIEKYKNRKEVIEEILEQAVNKKQRVIKVIYKKDQKETFQRFKVEATAILKECGIRVIFD